MQEQEGSSKGEERLTEISNNIQRFIRLGNRGGVNDFIIKGPKGPFGAGEGKPKVYVGYFKEAYSPTGSAVIVEGEPEVNVDDYYRRILELEVSPEVQALIPDNPKIRHLLEQQLTSVSYPSSVLTFGELVKSSQEIVILYSVLGVSAKTALTEIQNGIRSGLAKLN